MKLTREQVSKLNDVELNRALIWCYPDKRNYDGYYDEYMGYDYLTDYNLTMPLAHKFNLTTHLSGKHEEDESISYCGEYAAVNKNPLRAICEVLLMIAMER